MNSSQPGAFMSNQAKPTRDDIIALEKSYWEALRSKDGNRTAKLSADPALVTGTQGVMSIARSKMGKMTEEGNWTLESYSFDDIEVSTPTPDVAIIAYTVDQQVTMNGKPQTLRAADSSTWIRGSEGWQCHAHSETLLKDH
jgi:ketosteroid isomerase-like protein